MAQGVPLRDKFLTGDGLVSPSWQRFFCSLTAAAAAADAGNYVTASVDGSGNVRPNLAASLKQRVILDRPTTNILAPRNVPGNATWTLILRQDSAGGREVTFSDHFLGASALPGLVQPTPSTYTSIDFIVNSEGKSEVSNFVTNLPY